MSRLLQLHKLIGWWCRDWESIPFLIHWVDNFVEEYNFERFKRWWSRVIGRELEIKEIGVGWEREIERERERNRDKAGEHIIFQVS
jgi:hypothetical protein